MKIWLTMLLPIMQCLCLLGCKPAPQLTPLDEQSIIVAFGDSLTYGTGVQANYSYPSVLSELSGVRVVRSGVPGEQSAAGKARLQKVLQQHEPQLVLLLHGGNDFLRRQPSQQLKDNLIDMIETSRSYGAEVLLIAVPELGLFLEPSEIYLQVANETDVPLAPDILADLLADNRMKSDRIHLNEQGYRKLAERIHELLQQHGAL